MLLLYIAALSVLHLNFFTLISSPYICLHLSGVQKSLIHDAKEKNKNSGIHIVDASIANFSEIRTLLSLEERLLRLA